MYLCINADAVNSQKKEIFFQVIFPMKIVIVEPINIFFLSLNCSFVYTSRTVFKLQTHSSSFRSFCLFSFSFYIANAGLRHCSVLPRIRILCLFSIFITKCLQSLNLFLCLSKFCWRTKKNVSNFQSNYLWNVLLEKTYNKQYSRPFFRLTRGHYTIFCNSLDLHSILTECGWNLEISFDNTNEIIFL